MINPFESITKKQILIAYLISMFLIIAGMTIGFCLVVIHFDKHKDQNVKEISSTIRYVPTPSDTVTVELPPRIDTVTVLKEYYSKVAYRDTIFNNDTLKLVVHDTITHNGIASREVDYTIKIPETKIPKYGIGAQFVYGSRQELLLLGEYQYNRLKVLGGYDFGSKAPLIGVGVKILEW